MLTDAEKRELMAIESRLQAADPGFVQRFKSGPVDQPRSKRPAFALAVLVTLALILIMGLGLEGVLVVAFVGLLVVNRLAYRYLRTNLSSGYERHGGRMD